MLELKNYVLAMQEQSMKKQCKGCAITHMTKRKHKQGMQSNVTEGTDSKQCSNLKAYYHQLFLNTIIKEKKSISASVSCSVGGEVKRRSFIPNVWIQSSAVSMCCDLELASIA